MRIRTFLFFCFVLGAMACQEKAEPQVAGDWEFGSIVGFDRAVSSGGSSFSFHDDGKFERSAMGRTISGSWTESNIEGNHIITITPDEGTPTVMQIISLSHETLVYEGDSPLKRRYSLNRIKKSEEPKKKRTGKGRKI